MSNANTNTAITCMATDRGSRVRHENGEGRAMSEGCGVCTGRALKMFKKDGKEYRSPFLFH